MSKLIDTIELLAKEYPESKEIIIPFGSFLITEEKIAQDLQKINVPSLTPNTPLPIQFSALPLTHREFLFVLRPLVKTLKKSFPHLLEYIKILEPSLKLKAFYTLANNFFIDKSKKSMYINIYIDTLTKGKKAPFTPRKLKENYEEYLSIIELLLTRISRVALSYSLREIAGIEDDRLSKTCPFCSGKPSTSVVSQKEGIRELVCADCGRFWRFKRTTCPNCLHEEENNLQMIYIDDKDKERAMLCTACNHYIIEVDIRDRYMELQHVEAFTLALAYLDIIMLEKNAESI